MAMAEGLTGGRSVRWMLIDDTEDEITGSGWTTAVVVEARVVSRGIRTVKSGHCDDSGVFV